MWLKSVCIGGRYLLSCESYNYWVKLFGFGSCVFYKKEFFLFEFDIFMNGIEIFGYNILFYFGFWVKMFDF